MDLSCSLDVVVRQGLPTIEKKADSDALKEVIRTTHARMEKAFREGHKVSARRKG
jgi:hypothetical protein